MQMIESRDRHFPTFLEKLCSEAGSDPAVEAAAARILAEVKKGGDRAVLKYAAQFDRLKLKSPAGLKVRDSEFPKKVTPAFEKALREARGNVIRFSTRSLPKDWSTINMHGGIVGEKHVPFQRVGIYVPGGTAPLVSTCVMTITLAKCAGVREIVVCTPAGPEGRLNPHLLHAAKCAGATEIYRVGGVHAIGAMAYGTKSIPRVQMIAGPGNAYVTAAKRQVFGQVNIDLIAGPSEVLILADATGNPAYIAMDLLAQAEHGTGRERAILVTPSKKLAEETLGKLKNISISHGRREVTQPVLEKGTFAIVTQTLEEAIGIANRIAPEHLEIHARNARAVSQKLVNAGALFIGEHTPESVGDYVAGPSHVLPTGGAARSFSGLTVNHFRRRVSLIEYSRTALARGCEAVEEFARIEGLEAHGLSAGIRFEGQAGGVF